MSLRYALLGFLGLDSMTGYELKQNLDRSTQQFWHAGLNQIYPTLKQLEGDGLTPALRRLPRFRCCNRSPEAPDI